MLIWSATDLLGYLHLHINTPQHTQLPWSYKVDGSLEVVIIGARVVCFSGTTMISNHGLLTRSLIYDNADNRKAAIEAVIKGGMAYLQVRIHPIC